MACISIQKKKKSRRPADEKRKNAFIKVAVFLEWNGDEKVTIHDMVDTTHVFMNDSEIEPYGEKYTKTNLQEHIW